MRSRGSQFQACIVINNDEDERKTIPQEDEQAVSKLVFCTQYAVATSLSGVSPVDVQTAYTYRVDEDANVHVNMTMPMLNVSDEQQTAIMVLLIAEVRRAFPVSVTLDEVTNPTDDGEWSKPFVYSDVTSPSKVGKKVEVIKFCASGNSSKFNYSEGEFCLWGKNAGRTRPSRESEAKVTKRDVYLTRVAADIDATAPSTSPLPRPSSSIIRAGRGKSHVTEHENSDQLFETLCEKLLESGTKDLIVWLDVGKVAACMLLGCDSSKALAVWELLIERAYTPAERKAHDILSDSLAKLFASYCDLARNKKLMYTIETLMEHYERVSPESYSEWHNSWCCEVLDNIYRRRSEQKSLELLYSRFYRGLYRYCSTLLEWYVYNNDYKKWELSKSAKALLTTSSGPLREMLVSYTTILSSQDVPATSNHKNGLADLRQVIGSTESIAGVRSILNNAAVLMSIENMRVSSDLQTNTMPFSNVCISVMSNADNSKRTVVVHEHKREDNYLRLAPAELHLDRYSMDHPDVKSVVDFLTKMIPNEDTRESLCYWIGSTLWRGNRDRIVLLISGPGGNSKTALLKLLQIIHGSFLAMLKPTVYTGQQKNSGSADPDMMDLKGASIAVASELERGKTAQLGFMKAQSGGEASKFRGLYQAEENLEPTAKILLISNENPHIPHDVAMEDRVFCITADSRFDKYAPEDEEEQRKNRHYPADPHLESKMVQWRDAALWYFFRYLQLYVEKNDVPRSAEIRAWSQKYWDEHNIYKKYLETYYKEEAGVQMDGKVVAMHADKYFKNNKYSAEYNRDNLFNYIERVYGRYDHTTGKGFHRDSKICYGLTLVTTPKQD